MWAANSSWTPYNPTRLSALMTSSDWDDIWHPFDNVLLYSYTIQPGNHLVNIYLYETDHFGHVRIPLEPMAFCNPDGTFPSSHSDPKWLNLKALAGQIWNAKEAGLAVVLDCHPDVRTETNYEATYPSHASGRGTYPGPFKFDLATAYNQTHHVFNPSTHPLIKFWSTFPAQLDDAYRSLEGQNSGENAVHLDPAKVYFEILNEPLVDFATSDFSTDTELQEHELRDQDVFNTSFSDWKDQWKTIQKEALLAVRNWNSSFRCIATTCRSEPRDLGNVSGWVGGYFGTPYGNADLSGYEGKVIYTVHFYEPFRPTHIKPDGSQAGYAYNRDFMGFWMDPDNEPGEPETDPFGRGLPEADFWNGSYTNMGHIAMNTMFNYIYSWRSASANFINSGAVPFMITEFGCKKQNAGVANGDGAGPAYINEEDENPGKCRTNWYSESRRKMQADGYGWTAFDYTGGFAIWSGKLASGDAGHLDERVSHGSIKLTMKGALFFYQFEEEAP